MNALVEKLKNAKDFVCMQPASDKEICDAERALNVRFSDEYRDYLASFGAASIYVHELTGICKSKRLNVVDATLDARELNPQVSASLYLVEDMHIDGMLIWQDESGTVYVSKPNAEEKQIAASLMEYLKL